MQVCKVYKPRMSYLLRFELLFARDARSDPILERGGRLTPVESGRTRVGVFDASAMPVVPTGPDARCQDACRPPKSLLLS